MLHTYNQILDKILEHEGGFVDHPSDPGGATNYGITQATYDSWRESLGKEKKSVRRIHMNEVRMIYRVRYWEKGHCDWIHTHVSSTLALLHFDACVNHGVHQANRLLQRAAGVSDDGVVGPITKREMREVGVDEQTHKYLWERMELFVRIVMGRPASRVFLLGWFFRLEGLARIVLEDRLRGFDRGA